MGRSYRRRELAKAIIQRKRALDWEATRQVQAGYHNVLDGLNVFDLLAELQQVSSHNLLCFGPKLILGTQPETWAGIVVWYRRPGYHNYHRLTLLGVWVKGERAAPQVIVGTCKLHYNGQPYNPESYFHQIRHDFSAYYNGDTLPDVTDIQHELTYKSEQRIHLRRELAAVVQKLGKELSMDEMVQASIRVANDSDHDLNGMIRVANLARPEIPVTLELMRYLDSIVDPKVKQKRWVAILDDTIVGYAMYTQDATMYHPRKFRTITMVDPAYEQHGIGRQLTDVMLEDLRQHDPIELLLIVREDRTRAVHFAQEHGFVELNRRWVSRLDLTTFDPNRFQDWIDRVGVQGIAIHCYAEMHDDPQYQQNLDQKLYELHASLTSDIPMPISQSSDTLEQFRKTILDNPTFSKDITLIAVDGDQFVGVTEILELENGGLLVWRSGTVRSHRRRGIATALKVRSAAIAKERGYQFLETSNDLINTGILAINDTLGFVRDPAEIWMVLRLGEETEDAG